MSYETFEFKKIIDEIESEIRMQYMPDAIRWADENMDGAWSKAIDRFEKALETGNPEWIKFEAQVYKQSVLGLIEAYKRKRHADPVESFLSRMTQRGESSSGDPDKK